MHNIFNTKNKYTIYLLKQKTQCICTHKKQTHNIFVNTKNKCTIYLLTQKTNAQYIF